MSLIRKLNNGTWNKPPVLTAARLVFAKGLAERYPARELGDLADFVNGTSYDRSRLDMGDIPIIRISNITDPASDYIKTDEQFPERYHVSQGDLLVSWSASFKSILWPGPDGILNQHIFKVTERDGHARNYIRHAIEAAFDEMQRNVVGMGMMHLRRGDFLGHGVPCPPPGVQRSVADYLDWVESGCDGKEPLLPEELAEPRRIVAKIERLFEKVDQAREMRTEACEKVRVLLASVLSDAFPQPTNSTVATYAKVQSGYAFKSTWFTDDGIRLARNANVSHGALDWGDTARIPESMRGEYERFELSEGDILISLDRPLISTGLKVACVTRDDLPCLLLQRVGRFQFHSDKLLPGYLYHWLHSPHFVHSIDPGRSNGVPHISQKDIERIPFVAPSISEQRHTIAKLDAMYEQMRSVERLQQKTATELDALLPSILDKAFKGEL